MYICFKYIFYKNKMRQLNFKYFFILLLITFSACQKEEKKQVKNIRYVKAIQLKENKNLDIKSFSGIIKEAEEVSLAFRVAGPISQFSVSEGQFVKKGELIAEIDPRDYQNNLNAVEAEFKQIIAEVERVKQLFERNSIAQNDYDKAISGEKLISVKLDVAKNALKDTKLLAPFSGYIQKKLYQNHETVNRGMPVVTILNLSHLEVETEIPASLFVQKEKFSSFSCIPDVMPNKKFQLKLIEIKQKANMNQLYKMRLLLDKKSSKNMAPGMSLKVNIACNNDKEKKINLSIPSSAIFNENNQSFVWKYENGIIKKQKIKIKLFDNLGNVIVESGLKINDWILTAGIHSVKENQKVKLLQEKNNIGGLM